LAAPIVVLDARAPHAQVVAELHARAFRRGWSAEECAALLSDPRVIGLLAVTRRFFRPTPVGFALVREAAGEAEILSIGVTPQARGKGAGRALIAAGIDRLRLRGVQDLFLEVEETNAPALALYRAFGFTPRGRRESYYHTPDGRPSAALVMHLELG
jgi:ribosomal-protein-alanine N-acetyltransferase